MLAGVKTAFQGSLLDASDEAGLGPLGTTVRRTQLPFGAWVDVPRLLCFYDEGQALPDPVLTAARDALGEHYRPELGEPLCTAGLCLYRDGRDSVAWHGDTIGRGSTEDTVVAIVSLGTPRA